MENEKVGSSGSFIFGVDNFCTDMYYSNSFFYGHEGT